MATLELKKMTEAQFQGFRLSGCSMYARSSPHYAEMQFEKALELVLKDFDARLAPQGLQTPGQLFLAIYSGERQIGFIHLGEFPAGSGCVYGWNFHIFETDQRQGFGAMAMEAVSLHLKECGYKKVSLNVMAGNRSAIGLYEKFGFTVTQMSMERSL